MTTIKAHLPIYKSSFLQSLWWATKKVRWAGFGAKITAENTLAFSLNQKSSAVEDTDTATEI